MVREICFSICFCPTYIDVFDPIKVEKFKGLVEMFVSSSFEGHHLQSMAILSAAQRRGITPAEVWFRYLVSWHYRRRFQAPITITVESVFVLVSWVPGAA